MKLEIIVRRVKPKDALGILTVLRETWVETYPSDSLGILRVDIAESFINLSNPEEVEKLEARLANISPNECRVMADDGGRIVGIGTLVKHSGHNELRTLYVLPSYQGCGIGLMLWEEMKRFSDQSLDTIVRVATYTKAVDFYTKIGFRDTGKRLEGEKMKNGSVIPEMEMMFTN